VYFLLNLSKLDGYALKASHLANREPGPHTHTVDVLEVTYVVVTVNSGVEPCKLIDLVVVSHAAPFGVYNLGGYPCAVWAFSS
jgi:hypothetical protein